MCAATVSEGGRHLVKTSAVISEAKTSGSTRRGNPTNLGFGIFLLGKHSYKGNIVDALTSEALE